MANPKGTNPGNSGNAKVRAVEANVHHLDRSPPIANERPATAEAPRPEDRKPEPVPLEEARGSHLTTSAPAPKKSWRRTLLFALLPVALIAGGYFYVTGGPVMSTDNAYVQADMVGLSTDVSGIVTQVLVHDNQRSPRATSCSSSIRCNFNWRWIAPKLRWAIHATISSRFKPVTATCRPRSNRRRRMSTSTRSTSSARSN
jgi:hypothetical protein